MSFVSPPRPKLNLSVGITGHRPPVINEELGRKLKPLLTRVLSELAASAAGLAMSYPDLFDDTPFVPRFVSSLAEGSDQLAAAVALDLGYRLEVILPLPKEDYRTDFPGAAFDHLETLLERADRVFELPHQAAGRPDSYALAGRAMVAHCDVLIALWDGLAARGKGGTAEIVSLALRRGVPVVHLPIRSSEPGSIIWTGYGEFVDPANIDIIPQRPIDAQSLGQLVTALIAPPSDSRAVADLKGFLDEREWRVRPRAEYPLLLALLGIKRLRRSTFASPGYVEATRDEWENFRQNCSSALHGVAASLDGIERSFAWSDRLAQHFAQIYRSGHVLNFVLGAIAVLLALSSLLFPRFDFWLALLEPLAIATFVVNTMVGSRQEWHRRWLDYRQLAERLRPMRSLKLLGVAAPPLAGAQDNNGATRWTDWYARAEWRAAGCPSGQLSNPGELARAIVAEELKPQIDYHRASAHQMHLLDHRLHQVGTVLFITSILLCLVAVVLKLVVPGFAHHHGAIFVAASAGLPALGGAIFGIRMQGDFGGTAERSLITAGDLERVAIELAEPNIGLARQTDLAEAAATIMLSDLAEWLRAYERRALELPG